MSRSLDAGPDRQEREFAINSQTLSLDDQQQNRRKTACIFAPILT
jgi:hypothetical protein